MYLFQGASLQLAFQNRMCSHLRSCLHHHQPCIILSLLLCMIGIGCTYLRISVLSTDLSICHLVLHRAQIFPCFHPIHVANSMFMTVSCTALDIHLPFIVCLQESTPTFILLLCIAAFHRLTIKTTLPEIASATLHLIMIAHYLLCHCEYHTLARVQLVWLIQ